MSDDSTPVTEDATDGEEGSTEETSTEAQGQGPDVEPGSGAVAGEVGEDGIGEELLEDDDEDTE